MEIKRFFVDKSALTDNIFYIDGEQFVHMTKVLRHKVGYEIIIGCDDEFDYNCEIVEIKKDCCLAKVKSITQNKCINAYDITLFQAVPKGDKLDLITQKMVELGVNHIVPFFSQFTNNQKCNIERLNKISLEACKQCGRSKKCIVENAVQFDDILNRFADFNQIIMPYENAEFGSIDCLKKCDQLDKIAIVIGSEGGFSSLEVQSAKDYGAKVVSLGNRILRCETAAIVTAALVNFVLGEMNK